MEGGTCEWRSPVDSHSESAGSPVDSQHGSKHAKKDGKVQRTPQRRENHKAAHSPFVPGQKAPLCGMRLLKEQRILDSLHAEVSVSFEAPCRMGYSSGATEKGSRGEVAALKRIWPCAGNKK